MRPLFFKRVLWFVCFAVLAAGVMVLPVRTGAQEAAAAPAATTSAPATGGAASAEKAGKSEQAEMDVYRHAPVVQTIARMIHLPLETTARLFELINFAIIALAILIPLVKILPRVLHNRSRTLNQNLASARKMTEDANSRLSAVEAQMAKLDEEIAAIRARVEEESKQDEVRIKAAIEEESARIISASEQEITAAAAHAKRGIRHFAADLAIEQAARQLVLTAEAESALIAEFVRETAKGGQN